MSQSCKRMKPSPVSPTKKFFRICVPCPENLKFDSLLRPICARVNQYFGNFLDSRRSSSRCVFIVHFDSSRMSDTFNEFAESDSTLFPILDPATYNSVCCARKLRACNCPKKDVSSSDSSDSSMETSPEPLTEQDPTSSSESEEQNTACNSPLEQTSVNLEAQNPPATPSLSETTVSEPTVPQALQEKMRRLRTRPHPAAHINTDNFEPRSCLLFRPKEGKSLHGIPAREVGNFFHNLHPSPLDIRKVSGGTLAIDFPTGENLQVFLDLSTFLNIPVSVCPPEQRSGSSGVISGNFSGPEEVREFFNYHQSSNPSLLNISRLGNSNSYRLDFEHSLPDTVRLCYVVYKVKQYFREPTRCFKCQRFGHRAAVCRSQLTCSICAGVGHDFKSCTAVTQQCANCGGPHKALDKECPHRLFHVRVIRTSVKKGVSFHQAKVEVSKTFAEAVRGTVSRPAAKHQISSWAASARAPPTPPPPTQPPPNTGEKMLPLSALPQLFSRILAVFFPDKNIKEEDIRAILQEATE